MKPRWVWIALIGYAAVAAQNTLCGFMAVGRVAPDLVLAVAIFLALVAPTYPALYAAWGLGLARDMTSGGPLGAWALLFLLAAAGVILCRRHFYIEKAPARLAVSVLAAVAVNAAYLAAEGATSGRRVPLGAGALQVLGRSLYTGAAAAVVAWLLGHWRRRLGLVEEPRSAS